MSKNLDFLKRIKWKNGGAAGLFEMQDGYGITPPLYSTAPTPGVTYKGLHYRTEGGTLVEDKEYIVRKNAVDVYVADQVATKFPEVLIGASNLTLSVAQSNAVIYCGAGEDFVLPALTTSTVGLTYEFIITTTATSFTITAATGDLLTGGVIIMSTAAGLENDAFSANGSSDLVLSMNGTTQGGIVGSWVKYTAATATQWLVRGVLIGSGTIVTPFS